MVPGPRAAVLKDGVVLCACVELYTLTEFLSKYFTQVVLLSSGIFRVDVEQQPCRMASRIFQAHGEFCASYPWEVIVATLTLTVCMLTVDQRPIGLPPEPQRQCNWGNNCLGLEEYNAVDVIVMTIIRCVAVLYSYYQFCQLHKLGSKYILDLTKYHLLAMDLEVPDSILGVSIFICEAEGLEQGQLSLAFDMSGDALFFFLLLIDLSKATLLAQFALSARSHEEVKHNIARGMAILGPTITLDTLVETLVIGVGTLSVLSSVVLTDSSQLTSDSQQLGVRRLEVLCCFACMSVIVNYIVFMSFYPACLSLILELSRCGEGGRPAWHDKSLLMRALHEEDQKPNPVVQRVKVIMSAGLTLVHVHSRWSFANEGEETLEPLVPGVHTMTSNHTEDAVIHGYIMRWLTLSADHIVILILLLALTVKFIFFEDCEERSAEHLLMNYNKNIHQMFSVKDISGHSPLLEDSEGWIEVGPREDIRPVEHKEVQTDLVDISDTQSSSPVGITSRLCPAETRSVEECLAIYKSEAGAEALTDDEAVQLVKCGHIPTYQLEKAMANPERGVHLRRKIVGNAGNFVNALADLPYQNYDYSKVMGACCENVIGYMPVPVGLAGPLLLDGRLVYVPMATTEGCLVASTNRGSRALMKCGVTSRIVADGMTRGPVVRFTSIARASEVMEWMQSDENFESMKRSFDSTTVNWIEGRGKSVVCEAIVPSHVVKTVLKTSVHGLVDVNIAKNLIGSAIAGSIGGFNAHAANVVTAIFIATGQDPAQNVSSSNCMTLMEPWGETGEDLYISVTMPSIEIGTIGGGTVLPPQGACLEMLGVKGPNIEYPGENANTLARIVCATVLAGELSLMSALTAGHLVKSHLRHNRSSTAVSGMTHLNDQPPTITTDKRWLTVEKNTT
uniref:3-hydroxy-3-methylglutaryl-coenzyme A reductase n=1 Tax=Timema bartmani TaxID=61472 RepID=A0A7R9HW86_9NEOP|nr:unnamed protein product [Timema bartmani]